MIESRLSFVRFDRVLEKRKYNIYLCTCGKEKSIGEKDVKRNRTISCGCYNIEKNKERTKLIREKHPNEEVLRLRLSGATQKEIENQTGCSKRVIYGILKRNNMTIKSLSKAEKEGLTPFEILSLKLNLNSENGCLEYISRNNTERYGRIQVDGIAYDGHRLAYQHYNGQIPSNMFVCHTCDNRKCCNIDRLFLGTIQENTADMKQKGRAASGENNGNHKVTSSIKAAIFELRQRGLTYGEIAEQVGLHRKTIQYHILGRA
jgi:DNA-binding CsgD family transcriptional regulator